MKKSKIIMAALAFTMLVFTNICPVNAASSYTTEIARADISMKYKPSYDSKEKAVIKKGEKVRNYGIDFEDGDGDFDHVYRNKTRQYGYVNHHNW